MKATSHFIPVLGSVFDVPQQAANGLIGQYDILNTKYYPKIDYYNLKSKGNLTILGKFETYQQTSE